MNLMGKIWAKAKGEWKKSDSRRFRAQGNKCCNSDDIVNVVAITAVQAQNI